MCMCGHCCGKVPQYRRRSDEGGWRGPACHPVPSRVSWGCCSGSVVMEGKLAGKWNGPGTQATDYHSWLSAARSMDVFASLQPAATGCCRIIRRDGIACLLICSKKSFHFLCLCDPQLYPLCLCSPRLCFSVSLPFFLCLPVCVSSCLCLSVLLSLCSSKSFFQVS